MATLSFLSIAEILRFPCHKSRTLGNDLNVSWRYITRQLQILIEIFIHGNIPLREEILRLWRKTNKKKLRDFQPASCYRLSAKLVPNLHGRNVSVGHRNGSPRQLISVFYTRASTFLSSSSSVILTNLSGPRSRPTSPQKIWKRRGSNPKPANV
jgi:hypothetical protein